MVELCEACGAAPGGCACPPGATAPPLELDFDRGRPPPSAPKPLAPVVAPISFQPEPRRPLPPPVHSGGIISGGTAKLAIGAVIVALLGIGIWAAVRKIRTGVESVMDEAATRPYVAPSRLIIAAVTSDYGSDALADGSIVLSRYPVGSAAGLAAWFGAGDVPASGFVEQAITGMIAHPTYRPLETPDGPCRSDAETSTTTLGEVSFADDHDVTLWTCTITKHDHAYLIAWAALSTNVGADKQRLVSMLKSSQLVSNDLCALNVINGGCKPSASRLIATLVERARR